MMRMTMSCIIMIGMIMAMTHMVYARFPADFAWGAATASYQIEGAYQADGRLMSEWDTFSHTAGKTAGGATGDVADRSYDLVDVDIALLKAVGFKHYRFSLSWGRIIMDDAGTINTAGVAHYNRLIDALLIAGIQPFVTLFHWDMPLLFSTMNTTQTRYAGWLDTRIVPQFEKYADIAFRSFGDRVNMWLTFNEPLSFCQIGYDAGVHAPGRCSNRTICATGDSSREPYQCTHTILLAHAAVVHNYRDNYQKRQGGRIGITLNSDWSVPLTDSQADRDAAQRNLDFMMGWFADPIFLTGDYPSSMRQLVGDRLPRFTAAQSSYIKGTYDFFGLNHYTSAYISNLSTPWHIGGWFEDQHITSSRFKDGVPIGPRADSDWLYVVPWAFRNLLHYINDRYGAPAIYITENGCDAPNEDSLPIAQALNDTFRVDYFKGYLASVEAAIDEGVDVRGYFAWSLMDNFEWADGYSKRFGIHYVDYKDNQKRYQKNSAIWFKQKIATELATSSSASAESSQRRHAMSMHRVPRIHQYRASHDHQ